MTTDIDELDPQPGFHIFGGEDRNHKDFKDPSPIKWLTGGKYQFELSSKFEEHAHIKRWCEENCKDTVAYLITASRYQSDVIYFFSETDAAAFKLRWL